MSLQDKMLIKNKKGVSEMVGYVLLVVFAVIIGAIIFAWLRTYVPAEALNCPDGISVFIKEATFNASTLELNLSLRNNGRFDIAGYFIHATNSSAQELPTIDLSPYLNNSFGGMTFGNSVVFGQAGNICFGQGGNLFKTGEQRRNIFNIPPEIGEPYSIRIIPTRFQEADNRQRFVSCSDAKVQQLVGVPFVCVSNCTGKVCGSDGCGGSCSPGCNPSTEFCDAVGQCISSSCTPASNPCGTFVCGTAQNGTCGSVNCGVNNGLCSSGFTCNATGQCISLCGNGIINTGEACDDGNTANLDGCSSSCQVEGGWTCSGQPSTCLQGGAGGSFNSCGDYCDTFQGYSNIFSCVQNSNQCAGLNKTYMFWFNFDRPCQRSVSDLE
ncbi:MAG: myxococcus cysteine-rich repeat containing protein, partial [Patescibacteria group bacterium]